MEDAEVVLVSMGTTGATARLAVDRARSNGLRAGSIRVRMFRPWPEQILQRQLAGVKRVGFVDRDISAGMGGVLWSEGRHAADRDALVQNYIIGLGGGDIRPTHLLALMTDLKERETAGAPEIREVG
jgi:pyruvate/2-oxoacid:ferredoxin oxidoreductase alpha subunit